MRNLKLEVPRMKGPDVEDWQRFLAGLGIENGDSSGEFGTGTAAATRTYQASKGLGADGVVGLRTYCQAVRDGMTSSTRVLSAGMDANLNCTKFAQCITADHMKFVVRYYSAGANSKNLTRPEALALSAAGLKLAVVYQDAQNKIESFSADEGKRAAKRALALAATIRQPEGSAIYFAADFDPTPDEVRGPITDYFHAVSQTFAAAQANFAIGVYGSGLTCRVMRDASLAKFAWLSASSGFRESNNFRPRAHLLQAAPEREGQDGTRTICGGKLLIDDDIAQTAEFGAFQVS